MGRSGMNSGNKSFVRKGLNILFGMTLSISIALAAILYLSRRIAYDGARDVTYKAHVGMVEQIDNLLDSMEQCSYSVAYSPEITEVLEGKKKTYSLIESSSKIRMIFSGAFVFSRYMTGIALYDSTGKYIISSGLARSSRDRLEDKYLSASSAIYSGIGETESGETNYWMMIYPIYSRDVLMGSKTDRKGYLAFTVNWDYFQAMFAQNSYNNVVIKLMDQEGRVLLSNNRSTPDTQISVNYESVIKHSRWVLQSIQSDEYIEDEMKPLLWAR